MMGLLSTIRSKNKEKQPILDEVVPMTAKEKRVLIAEWDPLLREMPDLFKTVWIRSAKNSTSIKKAFGMEDNEIPGQNENFMKLSPTIAAFFKKLVITYELNEDQCESACIQLGARHVDFMQRGFHSTFWDVFCLCLTETIDETLKKYANEDHRKEVGAAWLHLSSNIVILMRTGYNNRRRADMTTKQNL